MSTHNRIIRFLLFFIILSLAATGTFAQKKKKKEKTVADYPKAQAVLWEPVDISRQDLFLGPGGDSMKPDLSAITHVEDDKTGHNKKYKFKDASGQEWTAKLGREARPETVAVRLLYGLGYKTEVNYLIPTITIPGKGTFTNVRLKTRPEGVKSLDPWKWRHNPFVGTNELGGLKIMMVFMDNWDLLDMQNKVLYAKDKHGGELQYVVSDLGATFGRMGYTNIPMFYRLGRSTDNPRAWSKARFIKGVKGDRLILASTGQKSFGLMKDVTVEQGRWLYDRLSQLDDRQIADAFRAANYSPADVDILTKATKRRITELGNAVSGRNLAVGN